MGELARYDSMCRAIAEAHDVDEVTDIRNKAAALEYYARQAGDFDQELKVNKIRIRAERRFGELSKEIEKSPGGRPPKNSPESRESFQTKQETLERLGVSSQQASERERLAGIPKDEFQRKLAEARQPLSTSDFLPRNHTGLGPVSDDALLFIGTMRDFERRGYLASTPEHFMATMTDLMREEVYKIAPLACAWLSTIRKPTDA